MSDPLRGLLPDGAGNPAMTRRQWRLVEYLQWIGSPVPPREAMEVAGYPQSAWPESVLANLTLREPRLYETRDGWIGLLREGDSDE